MSDITDLNPIINLVNIKRKSMKEYKEMLKDLEIVTRDVIQISMRLTKEQRDQMIRDQNAMRDKMQKEALRNNKKSKSTGVN